ncbi:DUF3617 domain-containing protein [Chitinimonas lacunae]|uniref:DUF3617 domain-containing protein n=1 Tax=Chitinimonas lacunae TaxID=1963018 RepID=A0ABV8MTV4_9NEIS
MRLIALFALIAASAAHAEPQATPGQWEITTKMSMSGAQKMDMPPMTVKFCLKPEDAKDWRKQTMANDQSGQNKDCKILEQNVSGNTVKFRMRCEGKQATDIAGEISYQPKSFNGRTTINTQTGQGNMTIRNEFNARHLGNC